MSTPTSTVQAAKLISTISANILNAAAPGFINPTSVPVPTIAYAYDTGIAYINSPNKSAGVFTPVWVEFGEGSGAAGGASPQFHAAAVAVVNVAVTGTPSTGATIAPPGGAIDGVVLTAGMYILLANQTTGSQSGLYLVTGVVGGVATIVYAPQWILGQVFSGSVVNVGGNGTLWKNSAWRVTQIDSTVNGIGIAFIGGPDPLFFPRQQVISQAAPGATGAVLWLLSATLSGIAVTDQTAAAATGTTAVTPGRGNGSVTTAGTGGHAILLTITNF